MRNLRKIFLSTLFATQAFGMEMPTGAGGSDHNHFSPLSSASSFSEPMTTLISLFSDLPDAISDSLSAIRAQIIDSFNTNDSIIDSTTISDLTNLVNSLIKKNLENQSSLQEIQPLLDKLQTSKDDCDLNEETMKAVMRDSGYASYQIPRAIDTWRNGEAEQAIQQQRDTLSGTASRALNEIQNLQGEIQNLLSTIEQKATIARKRILDEEEKRARIARQEKIREEQHAITKLKQLAREEELERQTVAKALRKASFMKTFRTNVKIVGKNAIDQRKQDELEAILAAEELQRRLDAEAEISKGEMRKAYEASTVGSTIPSSSIDPNVKLTKKELDRRKAEAGGREIISSKDLSVKLTEEERLKREEDAKLERDRLEAESKALITSSRALTWGALDCSDLLNSIETIKDPARRERLTSLTATLSNIPSQVRFRQLKIALENIIKNQKFDRPEVFQDKLIAFQNELTQPKK